MVICLQQVRSDKQLPLFALLESDAHRHVVKKRADILWLFRSSEGNHENCVEFLQHTINLSTLSGIIAFLILIALCFIPSAFYQTTSRQEFQETNTPFDKLQGERWLNQVVSPG